MIHFLDGIVSLCVLFCNFHMLIYWPMCMANIAPNGIILQHINANRFYLLFE